MGGISISPDFGLVHGLPPEILEEVFIQCLPAFPILSPQAAPLLLCRVCSSWRDIALHSSRLWSRITVDMVDLAPKESTATKDPNLPVMGFLQRSRNRPLSLRLIALSSVRLDSPGWKTCFNTILDRTAYRIKDLEISSSRLSKVLYSLGPDANFPQLFCFTVTSSGGPSFDTLPTPFTALIHSTLLKRVTYNAHISYDSVWNLLIPWAQLTHVTLTDVDYASWNYIFPRCISLQSGSFVVSGSARSLQNSTSPTRVAFPYLKRLSLHSLQSSRSPLSMDGYGFPNLEELTLGWNHSPGFEINFLSSAHHLEKLTITSPQYHFINMAEVLSILSLTPTVTQLHVLNYHCSNELFDALTYHACQQLPLLQRLRVLEVETPYWNSIHDEWPMLDALEKMLSSRWWTFPKSKVQQLGLLRMTTARHKLGGVREVFQHLISAGLRIELSASVIPPVEHKSCFRDHN